MTDADASVEAPTLQLECPTLVVSEDSPPSAQTESPLSSSTASPTSQSVKFKSNIEEITLEDISKTQSHPNEAESSLFELVEQQKKQLAEYSEVIRRLEASNTLVLQNCKELESRCEAAVKQKESAIKEKESMVVRYAVSEKSVLKQQTAKEAAEKRMKEIQREHDLLQHKLTMMGNEKSRICQMLDNKCYELKSSQQETERCKTDLGALETKLKWSQNSLKTEIELRKEAENKAESLQNQIQDYANEAEKAKKNAEDAIREFHTSQDNRAHVLDTQSKEQAASLIMLRHELDDRDQQVKTLQLELEKLQRKHNDNIQENNKLSMKVQKLEKERAEVELKVADLRSCADQQRQDAADLQSKNGQLEQMKLQLQSEQEHLKVASEQITLLKSRNVDLTTDMDACRAHESELLAFTQQLTDKNVALQSEFSAMETKLQQLTYENGVLNRSLQESTTKSGLNTAQMIAERQKLSAEVEQLQKDLAQCNKQLETVTQELADQQGENSVIKRKHELSLREVHKELAQCRKKLEQYESQSTASSSSSTTSLNTVNGQSTPPVEQIVEQVKVIQPELELDRHVLIDHIAKLQRISAKKSEKIDFMEEHVRTLVGELQKKSRLLQHYIKREQQGTLSSNKMDNNKSSKFWRP
ncbi:coiled-coil domain-containing protein 186 isoform X2 [Atheta coriaria]|uniref:coiled-coil domain-containing protein 186 isoform X2 n=1 Tax=Dalotia coriaria TaxID=877792 RepID=UPI0031F3EDFF